MILMEAFSKSFWKNLRKEATTARRNIYSNGCRYKLKHSSLTPLLFRESFEQHFGDENLKKSILKCN